ncbi:MAG TPA: AI-2E family transporter [Polyangia bacterium]
MGDRRSTWGALRWATLLLVVAAGVMLFPVWQAVVLATWFAVFAQPLQARVSRILRGSNRAAAALTILLLMAVLVPLGALTVVLANAAIDLVRTLIQSKGGRAALEAVVSGNGGGPRHFGLHEVVGLVQQYGDRAWRVLGTVAGVTAQSFFGVFIFLLASYTFLARGREAYIWVEEHVPIAPRHFRRLAGAFNETGRGLVVGVGGTAFIQGVTATIGYLALGVPRAFVLGVLTAFASLIPSIGTALVWVPVAIGLALTGHWVRGIIMAAIGLFVIGLMDNLLRPMLARYGRIQLPTFVLLIAMFGGLATVGVWGLVLGPLLVRLGVEAMAILREEGLMTPRGPDLQEHQA